jgi:hypothetical protein
MRSFVQKQNQPQKQVASSPARLNTATHAAQPEAALTAAALPRFGLDFSRIPINPTDAAVIQTKLAVNEPRDEYEREADRISEHVMRMPEPELLRVNSNNLAPGPDHAPLQLKHFRGNDSGKTAVPPIVYQALRLPGQPLDETTRAFMEPRFGYDFSRVRVHTETVAEQSARDINAHAYTAGKDIVFDAGRFAPETRDGQELIAHELTHVVQQNASGLAVQRQPAPDPEGERAAAVAEAEAAQLSIEQLSDQADLEVHYKLDGRKNRNKQYAWKLGGEDKKRIEKHGLSADLQREITTKVRFFKGEAYSAYLMTISPALSRYDEAIEIVAAPASIPKEMTTEKQGSGNTCDAGKKKFLLRYEGEPEKTRCVDIVKDEEFNKDLFDSNIKSAEGYTVSGTTWENVEYDSFDVMVVNYQNGESEYFLLNDLGNFYYGTAALVIQDHTYFKRANSRLIYPIYNNQVYFNEVLTPRIISFKNGLKYQVKELRDLYTLLQTAGAYAQLIALNAITEDFRVTLQGFRRMGAKGKGSSRAGGSSEPLSSGVPEPVSEEQTTQPIRPGEAVGETIGPYRINAERRMTGDTYEVDVYGLYREGGRGGADTEKKSDIRPVMDLTRNLINEGKAKGARQIKITGMAVANRNVLKIQRLAERLGGTATVTSPRTVEIIIPLK